MPEQTPSIGRIVHYLTANGPAPAIITYVHDDDNPKDTLTGIALQVFDAFGGTYGVMGIAEGDAIGQWSWPPKV